MDAFFLGRRNFSTRLYPRERGGFPREEESKGAGTVIPLRFLLSWSTFVLALIEEKKRERKGKRERGRGIIELSVCQQVARHRDTVVFKSGKTFFPPDWKHSKKEKKKKKNRRVNFPRYFIRRTMSKPAVDPLGRGKKGMKGKNQGERNCLKQSWTIVTFLSLSLSPLFRLVSDTISSTSNDFIQIKIFANFFLINCNKSIIQNYGNYWIM